MAPSYITRERLSNLILQSHPSLAVIDVRDDDHIGGHIFTSTNVPSSTLDYKMPELVRKLMDKEIVVFHCALSQQRGPKAAMRYDGERKKVLQRIRGRDARVIGGKQGQEEAGGEEGTQEQQVYILDGGFLKWQEL